RSSDLKSIERAQKKVEENNFGIRKRLLEYDDVMNQQREVIYTKRRNALFGDKISIDIYNMMADVAETIVENHYSSKDYDGFEMDVIRILGIASPVSEKEFTSKASSEIVDRLLADMHTAYAKGMERIREMAMPVVNDVFVNQGKQYHNIVIPVTDGVRGFQTVVNLEKAIQSDGKELTLSIEKGIKLAIINNARKEHIRNIDDLKQSVQNAVFEQKDPLLIYKLESYNVFKAMLSRLNEEVVSFLMKATLPVETAPQQVQQAPEPKREVLKTSRTEVGSDTEQMAEAAANSAPQKQVQTPVKAAPKIGRNDMCPCGSGKKYKNCHGQ